jgi:cation transport ATPase
MPEVIHTDDSVHSLVDVDSPHISSVPSDFSTQSVKTETQADRLEREEEDAEIAAKSGKKPKKDEAKAKAKNASQYARDNANNPVILGNAIATLAIGGALGYGAYRKYSAGELSWKIVGAWASVVGLFAAGDYYLSRYLFKQYPTKK